MIPQLIYIGLTLIFMGYAFAMHGEQQQARKADAKSFFFFSLIFNLLLYWGGFYDAFLNG